MNDSIRLLGACAVAVALFLAGCNGGGEDAGAEVHSADDGHDHGATGHEGHDHGEAKPADQDVAGHEGHDHGEPGHEDHGEERELGSVDIDGTSLAVVMAGVLEPGEAVNLDIALLSGPEPSTLRVWIGEKSGAGSVKAKAEGHGDHWHTHLEVPAGVDENTALWLEIQSESGERQTGSLPLE